MGHPQQRGATAGERRRQLLQPGGGSGVERRGGLVQQQDLWLREERPGQAGALANEPEVLLLDEPTASLDPDTADWIRSYFERYCQRTGATILLASHHMGEVERMCDHVLMMRRGSIADQGSPEALIQKYGRANLEEVFLDIARAPGERLAAQ